MPSSSPPGRCRAPSRASRWTAPGVVTSDEFLALRELPSRRRWSSAVAPSAAASSPRPWPTWAPRSPSSRPCPRSSPAADADVTKLVERSFKKRGITVRTGVPVTGHEPHDDGTVVSFGEGETVDVELVVVSVGRRPLTDGLGLDGTGVEVDDRGFVVVDERCRTDEPGGVGHRRRDRHPPARPRRLRRGHPRHRRHPRRGPPAGGLRPRAVVHLLPPRGRLRRPLRGDRRGRRARRRRVQAPLHPATAGP